MQVGLGRWAETYMHIIESFIDVIQVLVVGHEFVDPESTFQVICLSASVSSAIVHSAKNERGEKEKELKGTEGEEEERRTIDNTRHLCPSLDTTKCGSTPYSPSNQLESVHQLHSCIPLSFSSGDERQDLRSGRDLSTGGSYSDNSRYSPSFMTTFKSLPHYLHLGISFHWGDSLMMMVAQLALQKTYNTRSIIGVIKSTISLCDEVLDDILSLGKIFRVDKLGLSHQLYSLI